MARPMNFEVLCETFHVTPKERMKLAEVLALMRYRKTLELGKVKQNG